MSESNFIFESNIFQSAFFNSDRSLKIEHFQLQFLMPSILQSTNFSALIFIQPLFGNLRHKHPENLTASADLGRF